MQSYAITSAAQQGPKNYVFVDEHNRHKRLKVMRACEGCRRRKIRCDSATTNTWPCAACTRLKLNCVPPAGGIDGDFGASGPGPGSEPVINLSQQNPLAQQSYSSAFPSDPGRNFDVYDQYDSNFQKSTYFQHEDSYNGIYHGQQQYDSSPLDVYQLPRPGYSAPRSDSDTQQSQSGETPIELSNVEDLSQHLGDLKIAETGVAPYVRQQKNDTTEPDAPVREELEAAEDKVDKAFKTDAGSHIRIPPALMPSDEDAKALFEVFFRDVHPYVPVLNRQQFYEQWNTDKEAISPLVLEAVFACAGRIADEPSEGLQWLALANKHEALFLDTPRLSTIQALLLLLKAREGAPKRGYYYRSWMTCKSIVTMAKDLELQDHHEIHMNGEDCKSDPIECLSKTRVWQTALICEMMIGGPQGRYDMGVDPHSVDISPNPPNADVDAFEQSISRQFAFFVRNARNIRFITDVAREASKRKDGALAQGAAKHNIAFHTWPDDLPQDLNIVMPENGTRPVLRSHFIGNMHSHYHLGIVMLRRPQLSASDKFAEDPAWREHMTVCYNSAKILCRLQEAILAQYGLTGLLCMQRGISFTIYAVLTCVMIHLIAITAPDENWHADARDYFVRQMRVLECCMDHWPVPETVAQIHALRTAFSADLSKPFELKSTFPLGTPEAHQPSPSSQQANGPNPHPQHPHPHQHQHQHQQPLPQQQQLLIPSAQPYLNQQMNQIQQGSYLATPPVSAVSSESKPHSPHFQQSYDINQQAYNSMPGSNYYQQTPPTDPPAWNPTPIIDQFNTAFAIPASALAPPRAYGSPTGQVPSMGGSYSNTNSPPYPPSAAYPPQPHQPQQQYYSHSYLHNLQQQHPHQPQQQPYIDTTPPAGMTAQQQMQMQTPHSTQPHPYAANAVYVTPKEWQQSVASVYDPGRLKRSWDYVGLVADEQMSKRR